MRKSASPETAASQLHAASCAATAAQQDSIPAEEHLALGAARSRSRCPPTRSRRAAGRGADAVHSRSGSPGPPGLRSRSASCHRSGSRPWSAGPPEVHHNPKPDQSLHAETRCRSTSRSRSLSQTLLEVYQLAAEPIATSGGLAGEAPALPGGIMKGATIASSGLSTSTTTSSSASDSSTSGSSSSSASSTGEGARVAADGRVAAPPEGQPPPWLRVAHASPLPGPPVATAAEAAPDGEWLMTGRDGMATATAERATAVDAASTDNAARAEALACVAAPVDTSLGVLVAASPTSRAVHLSASAGKTRADAPPSAAVEDEPPAESATVIAAVKPPMTDPERRQPRTEAPQLVTAAEPVQAGEAGAQAGAAVPPSSASAAAAVQQAAGETGAAAESAALHARPVAASTFHAALLSAPEGEAVVTDRARRRREPIVWSRVRAAPTQLAPPAVAQPAAGIAAIPAGCRDVNSGKGTLAAPAKRAGSSGVDAAAAALLPDAALAASAATAPAPRKRARSVGPAAPAQVAATQAAEGMATSKRPCPNRIQAASSATDDIQQPKQRTSVLKRLGPVAVIMPTADSVMMAAPAEESDTNQARWQLRWLPCFNAPAPVTTGCKAGGRLKRSTLLAEP